MEIAFLIIVALIAVFIVSIYNKLVRLRVQVDEAWSGITVQLKRRADLIPNLIETVKGYARHEREVFENVTAARAATVSQDALAHPEQAAKAEGMLSGALKSLFAVAEAYPTLVASDSFLNLQRELTDSEEKIAASRRFYNGGVRDLNTAIKVFPNNLLAGIFKFTEKEFFEVDDRDSLENPPSVQF